MNPFILVIVMLFVSSLVAVLLRRKGNKADEKPENIAKDQAAEEKYREMCSEGESIQVVCRGFREEYYVLTDQRLIIDNKKGFQSIPFQEIKRVVFKKADGGDAKSAQDCQVMAVYADKRYPMARYSAKFEQIVDFLWKSI